MSSKHRRSRSNNASPDADIEEYCPNYEKYDKRARKDSIERINKHLCGRRDGIKRCVVIAVEDVYKLRLAIRNDAPQFVDDDDIISNAADQSNIQISEWDGVQIKQCKSVIDTFEKFDKKAKNHQDQTSWKISGDFFFAPYIKKAKHFLSHFSHFIMDISEDTRLEIQRLLLLSYAAALFNREIKFKRTKLKPLIRHRTLVKSKGIHRELAALDSLLTVPTFIHNAKQKRKEKEGKSNIIAKDLFADFKRFVNKQYLRQKRRVYALLHIQLDDEDEEMEHGMDDDDGADSILHDTMDDDDEDEEEEDDTDDASSIVRPITQYKRPIFTKSRAFQSIVRTNVLDKQHIAQRQRKVLRTQRVDNLCASAVQSTRSSCSLPYVSSINGGNMDSESDNGCSDCVANNTNHSMSFRDDRSFASLSTATVTTPSISPCSTSASLLPQPPAPIPPPRPPPPPPPPPPSQSYRPFRYYPATAPYAPQQKMIVQMIQRENEILRSELRRLGGILSGRRRVYPQQMMHYYPRSRRPAFTPIPPPLPPAPRVEYTSYDTQKQSDIPPAVDDGASSIITSDNNTNNNNVFDANPSCAPFPVDPYNESMPFIPDPATLSPDPFTFNKGFDLDSVFFSG